MKTFKRIVTIIISLAYVVFLFLCVTSPAARMQQQEAVPGNPVVAGTDAAAKPLSLGTPTVDFAAGSIPEDTEELTLVLQEGEVSLLDRLTALKSADLRGSTNLEEILAWGFCGGGARIIM